MTTDDDTRKQLEDDNAEDLELAAGDAENVAGGDKAKQQPIKYLTVTMKDAFITDVSTN